MIQTISKIHSALFIAYFCSSLSIASASAYAQKEDTVPLEITADDTLEWHRDDLKFIAKGNVIAAQGDVTIKAMTLTADYRETENSSFDIYQLTADKNVVISSNAANAYGNLAVYDVDEGKAVMTGDSLRMTSPEQTVTARDSFEYFVTDGKLVANGNVHIVRGENTIDTDHAFAVFTENAAGQRQLQRLEAIGHVVITTPTEVLRGEQGYYDAATNIAQISGNVKITRGPNVLEGEQAEVDLTTNISRMFGNGIQNNGQGRVRGVFYPDSAKEEQENNKEPIPESYPFPQPIQPPPTSSQQGAQGGGLLTAP